MTPRDPELMALADTNLLASFDVLVRYPVRGGTTEGRAFGGARAFATGRSSAYMNPIIVVEPVRAGDLDAAIGWMRGYGRPFSVRLRDDLETAALRAVLDAAGLTPAPWSEPAMLLSPLRPPPPPPSGLVIEPALAAAPDRFYAASAAGFGIAANRTALVSDLIPPSAIGDPAFGAFGGFLGGVPVGCSMAIRSGSVVGVYAVGTAESARRRGVGTALTWAAIGQGIAWGCRTATLQASEMGEPLYRAMGFRTVARYRSYETPRSRPSEATEPTASAGGASA